MADGVHASVEGDLAVIAAFHAVAAGVDKIGKAQSSQVVASAARRIVPVLTGRLRDTIASHIDGEVTAGGALPYARVIHFGWAGHNIQPQPFLYWAAAETQPDITHIFNTDVKVLARGAGLNVL